MKRQLKAALASLGRILTIPPAVKIHLKLNIPVFLGGLAGVSAAFHLGWPFVAGFFCLGALVQAKLYELKP